MPLGAGQGVEIGLEEAKVPDRFLLVLDVAAVVGPACLFADGTGPLRVIVWATAARPLLTGYMKSPTRTDYAFTR